MRTTPRIEADLAQTLRERARHRGVTLDVVVNEALRRGLSFEEATSPRPQPFRVRARALGFAPGIDPDKLNQLVGRLDVDRFLEKERAGGRRPLI